MKPSQLATELEEEAERTGDLTTWAVATDAWEEAGDPTRAWYCFVRSTGRGRDLISRREADQIMVRLEAYRRALQRLDELEDIFRPGNVREEERVEEARVQSVKKWVSSEDRGALELFDFMAFQPKQVLAFGATPYDTHAYAREQLATPNGFRVLGRITSRSHAGPTERVYMEGVNGFRYSGPRAVREPAYRLHRGKSWLRR